MAKIQKASQELEDLFEKVKDGTTLKDWQWLRFEVLCNNKQKELYKIVKTNDIVEILTDGVNFAVVFNEEIFDQLPDDMKEIVIVECLAGVAVDDNDKVSYVKADFTTYTGVLKKYGHDPIIVLHESIKSLYDARKQKEDEEKAQKKEAGAKRKGFPKANF
jgi:TRAP-type mannitol/chloroaromatic compound transport system substrate-binding protein